jgi:hypothetical protein
MKIVMYVYDNSHEYWSHIAPNRWYYKTNEPYLLIFAKIVEFDLGNGERFRKLWPNIIERER